MEESKWACVITISGKFVPKIDHLVFAGCQKKRVGKKEKQNNGRDAQASSPGRLGKGEVMFPTCDHQGKGSAEGTGKITSGGGSCRASRSPAEHRAPPLHLHESFL